MERPQRSAGLSIENRRTLLEGAIAKYVTVGYRVVSSTDTTAQMVRPKKFSFLWATLWSLVFGVGLLVYVFYYTSKKEDTLYLSVDERGRVKATRGKS